MTPRLRLLVLLTAAALISATGARAAVQKTTQDKIYSTDQADRGAKQYATMCATCHDPAKVPAGKKPGPPLVGDVFLTKWDGHTVGELLEQTLQTMPNDGLAVLTEEQTADLIAYILQANKMPEGPTALKYDAGKDVVIKK